jgi:hypothetical protein
LPVNRALASIANMDILLNRITLITVFLFFTQASLAKDNYLSELKDIIVAVKHIADFEKGLSDLQFDTSIKNTVEFKTAINQCVVNDLDKLYEKVIPTIKKHYSISEFKTLRLALQSKAGKIYLDYITGVIVDGSLTQEQITAINNLGVTKEILALEPLTAELSENTVDLIIPFRDFCMEKYIPEM